MDQGGTLNACVFNSVKHKSFHDKEGLCRNRNPVGKD